jgi:hypothetical protein
MTTASDKYREIKDGEGGLGKQADAARLDRVQPKDYVYRLMLSPTPSTRTLAASSMCAMDAAHDGPTRPGSR